MSSERCGNCVFRIPIGDPFRGVGTDERLRCAIVKGPIKGNDVCDLFEEGFWIEDWVQADKGKKSRSPGSSRNYEEYKLPKGHTRVNYRERVKSVVKEKAPEPS